MGDLAKAPQVRIAMLGDALARRVHLERIVGGRFARAFQAVRWLVAGGTHRAGAVYVEASTSSALPQDLLFLALMRLLGRPVGVYFRDAYQRYRHLFPLSRRRQRLADAAWQVTMPLMRSLATHRFAPSAALAAALDLRDPILLPPGTDPSLPDLGIGDPDLVAAIVSVAPRSGFDLLLAAVERVRELRPAVRLRVVSAAVDAVTAESLPAWVEVRMGGRTELAELLRSARVCVVPLPITAYTDLAVPVRLMDLLGFGKPIVSTASAESCRILEETGAGLLVADEPAAMAAAIATVLDDEAVARDLARRARTMAEDPAWTWDARATTILDHLLPSGGGAHG